MNYAFFIGCKIPYYVPHYETAVREVCGELNIGLTDVEFNCCGYPMRHFDFFSSVLAAARNLALAEQAGLGDKVAMIEGAIGNCNIEPDSRDAVFSRGALLGLAEKDAAFLEIWNILKPGGQALFADFMAKTADEAKEDAAEWAKFEKMKPYLATVDQIRQGLSAAHLDVHELEDISSLFCSHILRGLAGLTETLKKGSVPKDQRPWVMWEVELWARRIAMLQAGNIGFYRVHASKSAD